MRLYLAQEQRCFTLRYRYLIMSKDNAPIAHLWRVVQISIIAVPCVLFLGALLIVG
jgi:hypothetical protein